MGRSDVVIIATAGDHILAMAVIMIMTIRIIIAATVCAVLVPVLVVRQRTPSDDRSGGLAAHFFAAKRTQDAVCPIVGGVIVVMAMRTVGMLPVALAVVDTSAIVAKGLVQTSNVTGEAISVIVIVSASGGVIRLIITTAVKMTMLMLVRKGRVFIVVMASSVSSLVPPSRSFAPLRLSPPLQR